jgi:hypothetical protein
MEAKIRALGSGAQKSTAKNGCATRTPRGARAEAVMGVVWHGMVGSVTLGTREVKDPLLGLVLGGLGFEGDGAMGVEELVGDVGQDGSAAGGDATFGDEGEKAGEELVDVEGGVELGELREEFPGEVEGIIWRLLESSADGSTLRQVVEAETQMGTGGEFPAAFAVGEEVLAAALFWRMRPG